MYLVLKQRGLCITSTLPALESNLSFFRCLNRTAGIFLCILNIVINALTNRKSTLAIQKYKYVFNDYHTGIFMVWWRGISSSDRGEKKVKIVASRKSESISHRNK